MPEFSRTAKRRHTFAFVSTPLPAPFSPFSFDTTAANRSDPLFFFSFFSSFFFFSFLVDAHTSRARQRHGPWLALDQMKTRFSARYWLALWLKFVDRRPVCTPVCWTAFDNHPRAFFLVLSSLGIN